MVTKRVRRPIWFCTCERCGHTWEVLGEAPPKSCARCKSKGWNTPPGSVKPGPKPKAKR